MIQKEINLYNAFEIFTMFTLNASSTSYKVVKYEDSTYFIIVFYVYMVAYYLAHMPTIFSMILYLNNVLINTQQNSTQFCKHEE